MFRRLPTWHPRTRLPTRNAKMLSKQDGAHDQVSSARVQDRFRKKTCCQFIPVKTGEESRCGCGRLRDKHSVEAQRPHTDDAEWEASKHTKEDGFTDAFGQIEFRGGGPASRAKFIRISSDTKAEDVLSLMEKEWHLALPKLVISVTGGNKNFDMHSNLKLVFQEGLLKVAQTTGAWIISGGTNTGVMRLVGKTCKGHTVMSRGAQLEDKASQLNLIGITAWGIVANRSELIKKREAKYYMRPSKNPGEWNLDNNHSHFLLVDDGTEGKYGGEIDFRLSLQKHLAEKQISGNMKKKEYPEFGIPVVLVVIEGGLNTIRSVWKSVESDPAVPVVIANGSGRAADILAYALSRTANERNQRSDGEHEMKLIGKKIEEVFPENDAEWSEINETVQKCMGRSQYFTVFHVEEDSEDIDKAILKAILKAQNAPPAVQLDFALMWNRADIARTEIFTKDQKSELNLQEKMMDALISNRVEFVKLLLAKGFSMEEFLTNTRLRRLYALIVAKSELTSKTVREKIQESKVKPSDPGVTATRFFGGEPLMMTSDDDDSYVLQPYKELLFWSIFGNMQEMALFMWERGEENLARALMAVKLYDWMVKLTQRHVTLVKYTDELRKHSNEFKQRSLDLLDQCFQINEEETQRLLMYDLKSWDGKNCLSLAYAIGQEKFMAHVSCQTLLAEIWTGYIKNSQHSQLKTILGILIPITVLKTLEFHQAMPVTDENYKDLGQTNYSYESHFGENEEKADTETQDNDHLNSHSRDHERNAITETRGSNYPPAMTSKPLSCREKMSAFYRAPVTKFWANVIDYMVFLALFSYVILVRQDKTPSVSETVLIIFVFTLCTEEIRQILQCDRPTLKEKFKEWASSEWNRLDGLALGLFFIGLTLRLYPPTRSAGHVAYCFDVAMWIMRLMHFFSASKHMGPYVVMIGRMAVDLIYFLFIMMVFFLAYGIPQQAILYPDERPSWSMASRVFFRPYFQSHGELFIQAPDVVANTTTVFGTPRNDDHGDLVVSFMTAIYLLFVNILLLNLLIAIFNNTYVKVQANSNQIWKFKRYYLVMEYKNRPVLVPPFIILSHVIAAIKFMNRCIRKQGNTSDKHSMPYDSDMRIFEERCVDEYMRKNSRRRATRTKKEENSMGSVSTLLQDVNQRVKKMEHDMSRLLGKQHDPDMTEGPFSARPFSSRPENQGFKENMPISVPETKKSSSSRRAKGRLSPLPTRALKTTGKNSSKKGSSEHTTHVRSRQSPYLKSNEQRFPVPDFLVAWQDSFPGYDPRLYTAQEIQASTTGADPDILDPSNSSLVIKFNCEEDGINRRSYCGEIIVVDRLPRNPVGRTGITGRGLFGRWGPNHATYLIITRWKMDENRKIVQKKGKQVLEFLAIKRNAKWEMRWKSSKDGKKKGKDYLELMPVGNPEANLEWEIPGGMIKVGGSVRKALTKSLRETIVPSLKPIIAKDTLEEHLHTIIQTAEEVYKGYVDDPRNTDNAWMETMVLNFHDDTRTTLGDFEFEEKTGVYSVNWREVSSQIKLQVNLSYILHKVAMLNDAFF